MVGDRVLRASFWLDGNVIGLSSEAKILLLYLTALADADGIAPVDRPLIEAALCLPVTGVARAAAMELACRGHAAFYEDESGGRWAWMPRVSGEQPRNGALKVPRCVDRPAPTPESVKAVLSKTHRKEPTRAELKQACPRAFGMKRRAATGIPKASVQKIYEAWRQMQSRPEACHMGPAVRGVIERALKETPVDTLLLFIEYAYKADDAGPRYWRGQNQQGRTYLGLDSLLRPMKLSGRIQAMLEYNEKSANIPQDNGLTTLGPMASYRAASRARLAREGTRPPEASGAVQAAPDGPPGTTTTLTPRPKRLSAQCRKMLELFRQRGDHGVRTGELSDIALKYTGRISELRGAGHNVVLVERDKTGNNLYILKAAK